MDGRWRRGTGWKRSAVRDWVDRRMAGHPKDRQDPCCLSRHIGGKAVVESRGDSSRADEVSERFRGAN